MLNVPKNSTVSIYNSGCCGMAGSFGYEKNIMTLVCKWGGYFISKIISTAPTTTIAAAGTSCRHQILMERIETPNIRSLF
jgi:Fe-S oxidoreductase